MKREELAARLEPLHRDGFGWALACCDHDPTMAEEVLQVTYLKIMTGKARYDEKAAMKTWLFAVIRNTALEQRRRGRLAARRLASWITGRVEPSGPANPESNLASRETASLVRRALRRLSRRQREILHLVCYEGLTIEQSARILGLSVGTARVHYERGKGRLRGLLPREVRP